MKTYLYFLSYLAQFFLEWEMFQTKFEKKKISQHTFYVQYFFFKSCLLWDNGKNVVVPDRPWVTIWRMRIASWIPKATHPHSEYVIRIDFPLQKWLHEHASVLRYT